MARKKSSRSAKLVTRTSVATFVGVGLLTASAAAAAFGVASFSMSALRRPVAISASTATPASDIVIAGATDVEVARFTINAGRGEGVTVDKLSFHNCIARNDSDGDCADASEVTGNFSGITALTIEYTDSSGSVRQDTAAPVADRVNLSGLDMYVAAGSSSVVKVYADISTIDDAGVFSGDRFQVNLNATGTSFQFRAAGESTGTTWDESTINRSVMGKPMTLRESEPTISLSSSSPSGPAVPGLGEAFRFNVAADANGDIELNRVFFKVVASENDSTWAHCGGALDDTANFSLMNADTGAAVAASFRIYDHNGVACSRSTDNLMFVEALITETVVAADNTNYSLYIDTSGASAAADDALRVDILSHIDAASLGLQTLTWQDGTARGTAINGLYVNHLPLTGNTLLY